MHNIRGELRVKMSKDRLILILAVLFTLTWAFKIPYLFPHPFQPHEGVKDLIQEVMQSPIYKRGVVDFDGLSAVDLEEKISRELKIYWFMSIAYITLGCLSGYFLFRKKNFGRLLAIGLSSLFVGYRLLGIFSSELWREKLSFKSVSMRFEYFPIRTLQEEVFYLILLAAIILLLTPSIARIFKHNQQN